MLDTLKRSRKILYYTLVIACVFGILWTLYKASYFSYTLTYEYKVKWFVSDTLGYRIYNNSILRYISSAVFYTGFISVFALWKKPRPTWMFILVIAAGVLPKLVSGVVGELFKSTMFDWGYSSYFNIIPIVFWIIWKSAELIFIMKLFIQAEKNAKKVMFVYMIIIYLGFIISAVAFFVILGKGLYYSYVYFSRAAYIALYVITLVYLKKTLGEDMPLTKTLRMLKK